MYTAVKELIYTLNWVAATGQLFCSAMIENFLRTTLCFNKNVNGLIAV